MESIDGLIENNRNKVMAESNLERVDSLSIEFLSLVKDEAQYLRIHGSINYYLRFKKVLADAQWRIRNGVKKAIIQADSLLSGLCIYRNTIRPRLKKLYLSFRTQKKVRINYFFKLNDEEFITELYRVFLSREADIEGYKHNLSILQNKQCDRLDMIYAFNESLEGGRVPTKITGKFLLRMQKESRKK